MRAAAMLLCASGALSCGVPAPLGLDEPVRVEHGMLVRELRTREDSPVVVRSFENANTIVTDRQRNKLLTGRASTDAFAIAIRLREQGSGYWVLPLGAPDPSANDELTFEALLAFAPTVARGINTVELRAVDRDGVAGPASTFPLCVLGPVPDNLNSCDPTSAPPVAVFSLAWDTEADLDVEVELPDGRRVSAKRPSTAGDRSAASTVWVDTDAGAQCRHDGARRENVVLNDAPPFGRYRVYASLFDACGQSQVYARLTVLRRALGAREGTFQQVEVARADAQLLPFNVGAGERGAHLLGEFSIP